jgi:hypothetical protein
MEKSSAFWRAPHVSLDGIWLKHSWGGVDQQGYRKVSKEDRDSGRAFLRHLKERGW